MKRFNILIVDEDQNSISLLRDILSVKDFSIDVAPSINECFLQIENTLYDLILMEVKMSEMSGFDACLTIKRSPQNKDIPIIFLTSDNDPESIEHGFECGGVDYITKPFRSKELILRITNHLELKYSRELVKNMNIILEQKVMQRTAELEESLAKLSKAKKELESLSVTKSQLLNMISHEIRTPLNGIIGSMTLIGRFQIPEEINRYFNLLDISVKRLEKFSNTILEASKLRLNGKKILLNREINIIDILTESEKTIAAKYPSKIIETRFDVLANDTMVFADRKFLQKCFDAIFENAYKFSPQHETINVKISENKGTDDVVVEILDNGPGFSKSALEYLFQPLSNLESHVDQNTGMGLYLAKVIIDAHSGKITVGNRETRGAFVEISLPKPI
jgi:two-component system, sensor histidine kinase and response regulator